MYERVEAAARRLADLARADLARRLRVPAREISVESVAPTEWPDAGIGCPDPGKLYAAVLTPGYRIVLACAGRRYEYHSDRSRVKYCSGGPSE